MKVYLVFQHIDYDQSEVLKVFSSYDLAERFILNYIEEDKKYLIEHNISDRSWIENKEYSQWDKGSLHLNIEEREVLNSMEEKQTEWDLTELANKVSDRTLHTNGKGLWSRAVKSVKISYVEYIKSYWCDPACEYGELKVYFDTKSWDINKLGLIYTDPLFEKELLAMLNKFNILPGANISYSEQGMQGNDYVSLDVSFK